MIRAAGWLQTVGPFAVEAQIDADSTKFWNSSVNSALFAIHHLLPPGELRTPAAEPRKPVHWLGVSIMELCC